MAQSYIEYVLNKSQIKELRNKLCEDEFSDCNEELLVHAADKMEQAYNENNKRKREENDNRVIKKPKLDTVNKKSNTPQNRCDFCDRIYKYKKTLKRHLQSHFLMFVCKTCDKSFTRNSTLKKHKEKCGKSYLNKSCRECIKQKPKPSTAKYKKIGPADIVG